MGLESILGTSANKPISTHTGEESYRHYNDWGQILCASGNGLYYDTDGNLVCGRCGKPTGTLKPVNHTGPTISYDENGQAIFT